MYIKNFFSQVIVYPTRDNLQFIGAIVILIGIWILALLLASPMFFFKTLVHYEIPLHKYGIKDVAYCIEDWPIEYGRIYYSAFSLFVQYLLPILIVSAAYFRIYHKLKHRLPVGVQNIDLKSERCLERGRRMKRTNYLLISIAVIFGVSWLPLNIFNLYADIYFSTHKITQSILVGYAICHMIGMSSACSNPLLYGWLNENFRKEFKELLCNSSELSNINVNGKTESKRKRFNSEMTHFENKLIDKDCKQKVADSGIGVTDNRTSTELTMLMR